MSGSGRETSWWTKLRSRAKQWWKGFAPGPLAVTIEVVLITVAGLLGSIFGDQIRKLELYENFFSFVGVAHGWVLGFWLILGVTIAFVFTRRIAVAGQQSELLDDMRKLISTQPPANFLARFDELYGESYRVCETALRFRNATSGEEARDDVVELLESALRSIMNNVGIMADLFNPHHPDGHYGLNIMLFVSNEDIRGLSLEDTILEESEKFRSATEGLDGFRGFLRLVRELSCDLEKGPSDPKETLRPLSLPIPLKPFTLRDNPVHERDGHWHVLPGGPRAYTQRQAESVPDTLRIKAWCQQNTSLSPDVVDNIGKYMEEAVRQKRFQAFVSLPVPHPEQIGVDNSRDEESFPLAVLNLESRMSGFFDSERPVVEFTMLMSPYISLLSELLTALTEEVDNLAVRDLHGNKEGS